jgi:hypothetical protein
LKSSPTSFDMADPLHLLSSEFTVSEGLTIPFPQACVVPIGVDCCVGVGFVDWALPKCFLLQISIKLTQRKLQYSLPALALLNHAFNTVHSTVGTRDLSICSNMVSLHHIAADFPCAACSARLCGPPLDWLWVSIAIHSRRSRRAFLRARLCCR